MGWISLWDSHSRLSSGTLTTAKPDGQEWLSYFGAGGFSGYDFRLSGP